MKILVISNFYPPCYRGGYELSCQSVVDELRQRGHRVLVVTSDWQGRNSSSGRNSSWNSSWSSAEREPGRSGRQGAANDGVRRLLHFHEYVDTTGAKKRLSQFRQAASGVPDYLAVRQLSQVMQPEVAYIWNMSGLSLAPLKALQQLQVPMVFHLEDYWLLQQWVELSQESSRIKRLYRSTIQGHYLSEKHSPNHLITDSHTLKQQYIQNGFPPETITVIPTGLPIEHVIEEPTPLDRGQAMRLLYVGRLLKIKGVHIAIEAVAHLVHERQLEAVHLDIVGSGDADYTRRLRQAVTSLGLENHVHFRGDVSFQEVQGLYRQHCVLLFPSIWVEPFGRVVIEAMAQGLCVVASDRGGPAEHITHRENGLLVPAEDPPSMAQAVVELAQDDELRDHIRRAAIATIHQRYLLDKMRDRVEAVLQAVIAER